MPLSKSKANCTAHIQIYNVHVQSPKYTQKGNRSFILRKSIKYSLPVAADVHVFYPLVAAGSAWKKVVPSSPKRGHTRSQLHRKVVSVFFRRKTNIDPVISYLWWELVWPPVKLMPTNYVGSWWKMKRYRILWKDVRHDQLFKINLPWVGQLTFHFFCWFIPWKKASWTKIVSCLGKIFQLCAAMHAHGIVVLHDRSLKLDWCLTWIVLCKVREHGTTSRVLSCVN